MMQSESTTASYIEVSGSGNTPFMPDCFLTTVRSEESHCHSLVEKGRIKRHFSQQSDTPVALDRANDWLWSPAAFGLLL